ncbi:MAG: hypothetical protein ACRD96_17360, partial [Bryobacteraceae bacterium]
MLSLRVSALFAVAAAIAWAGAAADLARSIHDIQLDPGECYRVRDLALTKEDLRLYFTDGYLIFAKPTGSVPAAAVFTAAVDGGDAEILLLAPNRSERQSLATHTGAPNLNEHFASAVFLFSDDTYRELHDQIRAGEANKKSQEAGLLMASGWGLAVRNLAASFESRLVLDLLSLNRQRRGFFFAALAGRQLGNFDLVYDPRSQQQITAGKTSFRDERVYFDIWTAFEARSVRVGAQPPPAPEFELSDYRIDATLTPPDLGMRLTTRVKLKLREGRESVFPFDLTRQMRVTAATVDGQPAEVLERESMRSNLIRGTGNDLFLVVPAEPLVAGREYELEFRHEGSVIRDAGNKVYSITARGNWFPSRGLQFAHFDLLFRYPKELDLVSSGDIVSDSTEGDVRVTRRKTSAPIRLAGFNLGDYERA